MLDTGGAELVGGSTGELGGGGRGPLSPGVPPGELEGGGLLSSSTGDGHSKRSRHSAKY